MPVSIVLPYQEAGKYYARWAHEEHTIDFQKEKERAKRCRLSYAAEELFIYLEKMGIKAQVSNQTGDENIILLCEDGETEAFTIEQDGKDLLLKGDSARGLLYAVYELLEAQGIRWYAPKEEFVPQRENLIIPKCGHFVYDMPDGRGFHFEGLLKESESFLIWMARNRLNLHACHTHTKKLQEKLGFTFKTGGHIFTKLLDPNNITEDGRTYLDAHKDWYGKRKEEITAENAINVQFCVTNTELLDALSELVISKLKGDWKNEDILELAGFDTWGASCECEECKKLGNGADRTLHFLSHIRKRIDEATERGELQKRVRLSFDAYEGTDTLEAPERAVPQNIIDAGDYPLFCPILRCYHHNIDDNSCDKNKIYDRTIRAWEKTGMKLAMNEYYSVSKYEDLPLLFTERMKYEIPYYIERGVTEIQYMHTPILEWGVRSLSQYLYANLSRDRNCDADFLIEKYFEDVYGIHAKKAKKSYALIEEATSLCGSWRNWFETSILTHLCEWDGCAPKEPFYRESHLGENAVAMGYEMVEKLSEALSTLRTIKKDALKTLDPEIFTEDGLALNPIEQQKRRAGSQLLNKVNEDIRGVKYGLDVFRLMVLCLDYYEALYEQRADAESLVQKIAELGDAMSEYTVGINYAAYTPDTEIRDALLRSQLKNLYYKIIANHKGDLLWN